MTKTNKKTKKKKKMMMMTTTTMMIKAACLSEHEVRDNIVNQTRLT